MEDGWKLADVVHRDDPYDVTAFNLVELKDRLEGYTEIQNERFVLRMEPREAQLYGDRALALLDEPFSALDPEGRMLVLEVIRELRENGATVAVANHLPDSAAPGCTHHPPLEAGPIVSAAPLEGR